MKQRDIVLYTTNEVFTHLDAMITTVGIDHINKTMLTKWSYTDIIRLREMWNIGKIIKEADEVLISWIGRWLSDGDLLLRALWQYVFHLSKEKYYLTFTGLGPYPTSLHCHDGCFKGKLKIEVTLNIINEGE